MPDQKKRKQALAQIIDFTERLPAKVTYHTAWLGAVTLMLGNVDINTLSPTLVALFGGIGINVLTGMIERLANGDKTLTEDDILENVQFVIKQTNIENIVTQDELRTELIQVSGGVTSLITQLLDDGFSETAQRLIEQTETIISTIKEHDTALHNRLSSEFSALHRRLDKLQADKTNDAPVQNETRHLRIFISSPGDVVEERGIAERVIKDLNFDPEFQGKFMLEPMRWDSDKVSVPMLANETAQKSVNRYLIKPSQCDVVVVILWSRMGTKLNIDGEDYLSGTHYEFMEALEASENNKGIPIVLVYRCEKEPLVSFIDPEFDKKREQWITVNDFFQTFNDNAGSSLRGYNNYEQPTEFGTELEGHLKAHLRFLLTQYPVKILASPSKPDVIIPEITSLWKDGKESPFPGLRAFTSDDAPIYFGRGAETDQLVNQIREKRFVAVVGASGSGKSSLVYAGLIPRLHDGVSDDEKWHILQMKPGAYKDADVINPFGALYNALTMRFPHIKPSDPVELNKKRREYTEEFTAYPQSLASICAVLNDSETLLIIDQFEETFTLVSESYRKPFIDLLIQTARADNMRLIITMRSDFFHRLVEYPKLAELVRMDSFTLSVPRLTALHNMIVKPARKAGLSLEDGLTAQVLQDTGNKPGALALLAFALNELYEVSKERGDSKLTFDDYEALGGVQGAIGAQAERTYNKLPGEDEDKEALLYRVFRDLVAVDERGIATRQRALYGQLADSPETEQLIQSFVEARLLITSGDDDNAEIEVAHEALLRSWDKLSNWIEQRKGDLYLLGQMRRAAQTWADKEHNRDFLWLGERNKETLTMLERLNPTLNMDEKAFCRPEASHLLDEIDNDQTEHHRRSEIGIRLAQLHDPRKGVACIELEHNGTIFTVPDIDWIEIPGGNITLEDNGGTFKVHDFYMARFPVTFAQFKPFALPETYEQDQWWKGLNPDYHKQDLNEQKQKFNNHPRDSVSWYQAVAYTNWLDKLLHQFNLLPDTNLQLRLPTEWEWQQAATGGNPDNEYPWGAWDEGCVNGSHAGIGKSVAVGMYPIGASKQGVMGLSGNVFEWCLNEHGTPKNTAIDGSSSRVLRGGSFAYNSNALRSANRDGTFPDYGDDLSGFRCVVSVPVQE